MTSRQYPQGLFELSWTLPSPDAVRIDRVLPVAAALATELPDTVTTFYDQYPVTGGEDMEWTILTKAGGQLLTVTAVAEPAEYTYGEPDALVSTIRYADVDMVKRRIGVEDTTWDAEITQAIISAESAMDLWWGRAFPDTGLRPRWPGIPVQVSQAAENIAVAVLKQTDAPFGIAGSDSMMGELDIDDTVRRELHRSPLLRSFKVSQGMGLAR